MDNTKLKKQIMLSSETETSCVTVAKSETNKNIDTESSQSRKSKLSPDDERPSKVAKHDAEEDTSSAVSFLIVH